MKIPVIISAIFFLITIFSCQHAAQYDCTGVTPGYAVNVKPILDSYCAMPGMGCHGANGDAFSLADYAGASSASKKKSFMGSIEHLRGYSDMPRGGVRMPDAEIHVLACWVANGAPE